MPNDCELTTDRALQQTGQGSHVQMVREDGQVAIVKWLDSRLVVIASNSHGGQPKEDVKRWCKVTERFINPPRPRVITEYNKKMRGVDFLDRVIAFYRISARTKKWTVRTLFHIIDFALAAAWIERRKADSLDKTPGEDRLDFKVQVGDSLVHCGQQIKETEDERFIDDDLDSQHQPKRRRTIPLPTTSLRTSGALHLPEIPPGAKPSRCRFPGCDSPRC
ncbi:uncharacterized protein LOC120352965 [Nilaparvata lugens]|uniref:uncharacterized protein LOC120352965 n=1 Tax=Nilaparvata lugens TaxID=108931 RepID=UPI00193D4224|nr:uncharacterized protein LOC120352965 [Nilaparvata lugens]